MWSREGSACKCDVDALRTSLRSICEATLVVRRGEYAEVRPGGEERYFVLARKVFYFFDAILEAENVDVSNASPSSASIYVSDLARLHRSSARSSVALRSSLGANDPIGTIGSEGTAAVAKRNPTFSAAAHDLFGRYRRGPRCRPTSIWRSGGGAEATLLAAVLLHREDGVGDVFRGGSIRGHRPDLSAGI
jgi:hypothetical protein